MFCFAMAFDRCLIKDYLLTYLHSTHVTSFYFSQPYFSNGRAIGMSCRPSVCLSVHLSVTDVLWLTGKAFGKSFYTNK